MAAVKTVVDPHIHLWDLWTRLYPQFEKPSTNRNGSNAPIARSYHLEEYLEEGGQEFSVASAVHIEAFPTDPVRETQVIQAVADRSPIPIVMVAGGDLTSPEFRSQLDQQVEFPVLRGFRQVLNRANRTSDILASPHLEEALRELGKRGLSFDLQLYPDQMTAAARVIAACPGIQFIVNHAGMWNDRTASGWIAWKRGMQLLASFENVAVKISGLGMLDPKWTVESLRPIILETLEYFSTDRAMFASNFPVDKLTSRYVDLWNCFFEVINGFGEPDIGKLTRDNAEKYYRISISTEASGPER